MSSAFITLLSADKMNGDNYTSWKNMINTLLIVEDLKFAIIEECPQIPAQNASRNVLDAYEKWMKTNEKARAYILANLSEVLAKKHETMVTAREIMDQA